MTTNPFQKSLSRRLSDSSLEKTEETDNPSKRLKLDSKNIHTSSKYEEEVPEIVTGVKGANIIAEKVLSGLKTKNDTLSSEKSLQEKIKSLSEIDQQWKSLDNFEDFTKLWRQIEDDAQKFRNYHFDEGNKNPEVYKGTH